jgi:TRAP transporter TAXI family solute receptor
MKGSGGYAASAVALALLSGGLADAAPAEQPVFISIGGGAVDSAAFRWSSALAQILSRPPGLPKCDAGSPCGIPGIIAGAQTYDRADLLLAAIAEGRVATGILSGTQIYEARCAPSKGRPAADIRVLKALYRQPLQLIVPADSTIKTAKDLAGATIAVGERGSDSDIAATALLDAYGPYRPRVRPERMAPDMAIQAIKTGTAKAAIFVGHSVDLPIAELLAGGGFKLVALPDSPERRRLLRALPLFEPDTITAGTPPASLATISEHAFWVAGPALGTVPAEDLVATESSPRNAARLAELVDPVVPLAEGEAFHRLPAPLAEGLQHFAVASHLPVDVIDCPAQIGAK